MSYIKLFIPCLLIIVSFFIGKTYGEDATLLLWNKEKLEMNKKIILLEETLRKKESEYYLETSKINLELQEVKKQYDENINNIRNDYSSRLYDATTRADIYKRLSESSSSERQYLADHATKLSNSLNEGILLVRELRELIKLRDRQIQELGNQLLLDRKLMEQE